MQEQLPCASDRPLAIVLFVFLCLLLAVGIASFVLRKPCVAAGAGSQRQVPAGHWLAIGTGLTATATLWHLSPPVRATFGFRESNQRLGGRVLTTPHPVLPVSTWTQAMEFGAWDVDPIAHAETLQYLQALQVQTTLQYTQEAVSFVFTRGRARAFPALPEALDASAAYSTLPAAAALALWAHTGVTVDDAPDAALGAVLPLAASPVSVVPTGAGWIDVCLRAVGLVPVQYGARLRRVSARADNSLRCEYDSGSLEDAQGVLFTGAPDAALALQGLPAQFSARVRASLLPVSLGVMYITYTAQDTWWPALGFVDATAATDTDLGIVRTAEPSTLRACMSSATTINAWTALIAGQGVDAAKARVAQILATIFQQPTVPLPAAIAFRGWPAALWLWRANIDVPKTAAALSRPFGPDVPFIWACSELSAAAPNRVQGCVTMATAAAAAIEHFVA